MSSTLYATASGMLNDLPNISIALGEELKRAGISTPAELAEIGAEEAWLRLRSIGVRQDCIHTLLALEGAVQETPWRLLASERRFELMRFAASTLTPASG